MTLPSFAAVKSLSITASIPLKFSLSSIKTGIPPPPAAKTTIPACTNVLMLIPCITKSGSGDGTTLLHSPGSCSFTIQPILFALFSASCLE